MRTTFNPAGIFMSVLQVIYEEKGGQHTFAQNVDLCGRICPRALETVSHQLHVGFRGLAENMLGHTNGADD